MNTCPICGRQYSAPPAISRTDNKTEICPVCGTMESISFLPQEQRDEIIRAVEEKEIEVGRVEAVPG